MKRLEDPDFVSFVARLALHDLQEVKQDLENDNARKAIPKSCRVQPCCSTTLSVATCFACNTSAMDKEDIALSITQSLCLPESELSDESPPLGPI